jgi:alcohol dehydrogenase class IV
VGGLCAALKIPPLRTYGLTETDRPTLCEKAAISSSMKGNPLRLTDEELRDVLMRAL